MEHNSFPLEFQLPNGRDALQTAQKCCQLNYFGNVIWSIHVVSATIYIVIEIPFCSCNFDMGISYTLIFFSESIVYSITNSNSMWDAWTDVAVWKSS